MKPSRAREIFGLVASIALALIVAVFAVMAYNGPNGVAEGSGTASASGGTLTPDETGTAQTPKGIERFNVTDVQATPYTSSTE